MKGNKKALKRKEQKRVQNLVAQQAKHILLAGVTRRFGTDEGNGLKRIVLTNEELMQVPEGEVLTIAQGTPDGEPGITISVGQMEDACPEPAPVEGSA